MTSVKDCRMDTRDCTCGSANVRDAVAKAGCQLLYKPLKPLALRSLLARLL